MSVAHNGLGADFKRHVLRNLTGESLVKHFRMGGKEYGHLLV